MGVCVWKFCVLFFLFGEVFSNLNSLHQNTEQSHQAYDILRLVQSIITESFTSSNLRTLNYQQQFSRNSLYNSVYEKNFTFEKLFETLTSGQVYSKCISDFLYILQTHGNNSNTQALQLFDSYGKPGSGILEGNTKWLGDYNECNNIHVPQNSDSSQGGFNGKYCTLQCSLTISNFSLPVTSGLCIPDTCSAVEIYQDLMELLNKARDIPILNKIVSTISLSSVACEATSKPLNTPTIAVICLLLFFTLLAILGSSVTVYEHFMRERNTSRRCSTSIIDNHQGYTAINTHIERKTKDGTISDDELLLNIQQPSAMSGVLQECKLILQCFCVFTNGAKLLNVDNTEGQLPSIHGIRFLSMSWVILGHTFAFCITMLRNTVEAAKLIDNLAFQVILQGFYSVDSFFVLSGFLLTYLFMNDYTKRNGKIPWIYFYVHRFVRLTPVYMVVLGFSSTVYFYLGSGPFWPLVDLDPVCTDSWWWNILYINNFISPFSKMCMGWSWYLANDMQFFVISPLFLITLYKWPKVGISLIGAFLCSTWLANFIITYHYDIFVNISNIGTNVGNIAQVMLRYSDYMEKIYIKPYTRIGPYLIGMLAGYFLFKAKSSNAKKFSTVILCIGWALATALGLICVYVLFHQNVSLVAGSFYNAFNRICFGFALAWVIYVCCTDQGGFVNSILSFKLFIPLSRLTYCAYLIHPLIITGYFSSLRTPLDFSHESLVLLFLGLLVVSYGFSFLVSLIFESPIIALEKIVRNKFK